MYDRQTVGIIKTADQQASLTIQNQDVDWTRDRVYKIDCNDCAKVYAGQAARELHSRIEEHKRRMNKPPRIAEEYQTLVKDSAMAAHASDT
ncbi:hypothetical protein CLF_102378 [Clonorchis sinensis]|uniref:C2H2-type domain-containing protein n=1 Tax=Clonorchis sinensis TaxID=79923 RepID=G7Y7S7_CLOSI|nr:hypothetical protein CLF_102378 [Clonorchis sinensis]